MKKINLLVLALTVILIVIAVINRALLAMPIMLSLGMARFRVPLGLVLLGFAAVLALVFAAYLLNIQLSALASSRRHSVELHRQRALAETAELSRYTELRHVLEEKFESLGQQQRAFEQRLHEELSATSNSLAAYIGELDDRLKRQLLPMPANEQP